MQNLFCKNFFNLRKIYAQLAKHTFKKFCANKNLFPKKKCAQKNFARNAPICRI